MGVMASFGTEFAFARGRRHQTQQAVADILRVDRKTIDNWENGRTEPHRSKLGAIYAWAPELAEAMAPDEAELLATLTRLHESSFIEGTDVDRLMARYKERKRRDRNAGAAERAS